jgi:nucleoside-diphosphate-sugar epimerase
LVWLRIFYVYGPNQRTGSLIPGIIRSLLDGKIPEIKNHANANDFIYSDDVADGLVNLVERDPGSGIYNLGSGRATPVIEILRIIEKNIRNDNRITDRFLQNSEASQEINFWADMSKTSQHLNWQPGTSLEEGIRQTINSYGANNMKINS